MYINDNQLMLAENEVTLNKIEMDVKEKEEICKGIAAAQEKAFLPVDQNEFDDKPEHSEIYADIQNAKISGALIPTQILSLMFMGKAGTKIFAKRVAKGGALGDIALVFDYNDGNISEDVEVAMFDVMTIAMGNYGEHYDGINKDNLTDAKKSIKKVAGRVLRYWTGDSATLEETGVFDFVRNNDFIFYDKQKLGLTSDEKRAIYLKNFDADTFLTGTNAITLNGELFNIDGNGSRVAPMLYGPKQVIVVVGTNKLVDTVHDAIYRARNIAAPLDAKRLKKDLPCTELGKCTDCKEKQRICNDFVLITGQFIKYRIKVIIINGSYGF